MSSILEPGWQAVLGQEFEKPYMQSLKSFLQAEKAAKKVIYPKSSDVFNAFKYTPFDKVRVVILGQDPYHGPDQAHGLCFSVRAGVRPPPSLMNMYKELATDCGVSMPKHGCLTPWAEQGVLLLNSVLTVERHKAASHQGQGWEQFTDAAISALNEHRDKIIFVLWGSYAQKKGRIINPGKHVIIESVHPSPLSANRGFFGSRPFSKVNMHLSTLGQQPIDWQLPTYASATVT